MVRYASRAPSIDHQWATYVKSTSSVLKDRVSCYCLSKSIYLMLIVVVVNLVLQFFTLWSSEAGIHPTFISPVREPVHHMLLLISGCETQRFAGHTRLVVDISVKHIGLA